MIDADAAIDHVLKRFGLPDPFADADELAERIELWRLDLAPQGAYAEGLARLAAAASLRMEQAAADESTLIAHQATRARLAWDEDRTLDAETLGAKLARSKTPALVRLKLERTDQGAAWLAARWERLAEVAEAGTAWSAALLGLARRLLGTVPDDADGIPDTAGAQAALARSELDRIEVLREGKLRPLDAEERELAETGLSLAPSPPLARVQREHGRWSRLFCWSLGELRRVRTEAARAGTEPAPPPPPEPATSPGFFPQSLPAPRPDGNPSRPTVAQPNSRPVDPEALALLAYFAGLDGPRDPSPPAVTTPSSVKNPEAESRSAETPDDPRRPEFARNTGAVG